jgi:hypothetical protein
MNDLEEVRNDQNDSMMKRLLVLAQTPNVSKTPDPGFKKCERSNVPAQPERHVAQ